jgi:hypothetical protein
MVTNCCKAAVADKINALNYFFYSPLRIVKLPAILLLQTEKSNFMNSVSKTNLHAKLAKRLQQFVFTCLAVSFIAVTLYILINSPA